MKESDCGAICGGGRIDPPEACDPFAQPSACPSGQYCVFQFSQDQCTCRTPQCGNGIREPGEACDPPGERSKFCPLNFVCSSDCTACVPVMSVSGAFP